MSKSVLKTFLGSSGHFFCEMTPKISKFPYFMCAFLEFLDETLQRKSVSSFRVTSWKHFYIPAMYSGGITHPQQAWFDLKSFTFEYFEIEISKMSPLELSNKIAGERGWLFSNTVVFAKHCNYFNHLTLSNFKLLKTVSFTNLPITLRISVTGNGLIWWTVK